MSTDEQMWGVNEAGRPSVMWLEFQSENRGNIRFRSNDLEDIPNVQVRSRGAFSWFLFFPWFLFRRSVVMHIVSLTPLDS